MHALLLFTNFFSQHPPLSKLLPRHFLFSKLPSINFSLYSLSLPLSSSPFPPPTATRFSFLPLLGGALNVNGLKIYGWTPVGSKPNLGLGSTPIQLMPFDDTVINYIHYQSEGVCHFGWDLEVKI